jgi:hypothetical protein
MFSFSWQLKTVDVHDHVSTVARPQPNQRKSRPRPRGRWRLLSSSSEGQKSGQKNQIFVREQMKNTRAQFGSVCGSVDAGAHRAATGRERRADVTLCDCTSAQLLQRRLRDVPIL